MKNNELQKLLIDTFGNLTDKQLLCLTIYGESRGEGREGQIAVGSVIQERVEHREWDGDTIHEVCLMPYQFSCFLPADPNFIALKLIVQNFDAQYGRSSALQKCFAIASGLIDGTIPRTPEIAEHHICQYVETNYRQKIDDSATSKDTLQRALTTGPKLDEINKSRWWIRMKLVATFGHHEFYA